MNNKFIKLFFIIVLLQLFNNSNNNLLIVNGQITPLPGIGPTNLTITQVYHEYIDTVFSAYPDKFGRDYCTSNFLFSVADSNSDLNVNSTFSVIASDPLVIASIYNSVNGSGVFALTGSFQINTTTIYNFTVITLQNDSISYQIEFKCNIPDYSNLTVYVVQTVSIMPSDGAYGLVKVDGINHLVAELASGYSNSGDNYFVCHISTYYEDIRLTYWERTLVFDTPSFVRNFTLVFENPFRFPDDVVVDQVETFPASINYTIPIQEYGSGFIPLLQFRTNTTNSLPWQSGFTNPKEFRGSQGDMTYIDSYPGGGMHVTYFNGTEKVQFGFAMLVIGMVYNKNPVLAINTLNIDTPMFKHQFNETNAFNIYHFNCYGHSFEKGWPFGFIANDYNNKSLFYHEASIPMRPTSVFSFIPYYVLPIPLSNPQPSNFIDNFNISIDVTQPKVLSYEFIRIKNSYCLLKIQVYDESGLSLIQITRRYGSTLPPLNFYAGESLVEGDLVNGTYEIVLETFDANSYDFHDSFGNIFVLNEGYFISLNPITYFKSPNFYYRATIVKDISFLYNHVNVVDQDCNNTIYIKVIPGIIPKDASIAFKLRDHHSTDIIYGYKSTWFANWNETLQAYTSDFIIPRGTMFGIVQYALQLSALVLLVNPFFPPAYQLIVNETYVYKSGPIFTKFEKLPNDNPTIQQPNSVIGFRFEISDDYNGFEKGYIKLMGSLDNSVYHYNFTLNDAIPNTDSNKFIGIYEILLNIATPCLSQDYVMTSVHLTSFGDITSIFNTFSQNPDAILNPFRLFLNDSTTNRISFTCSVEVNDPTPPELLNFKVSHTSIDVGLQNRTITFDFEAMDQESGLKQGQNPIVYLVGSYMQIVECESSVVSSNSTNTHYRCSVDLKYGFSYPGPLLLQVYGFISNGGLYSGFSSFGLQEKSMQYYINTTLTVRNIPIIKSNSNFTSTSGTLQLFGIRFMNVISIEIKFKNQQNTVTYIPSSMNSSAITINSIFSNDPFTVKAITINGFDSNEYTVTPYIVSLPTNGPQQCKGDPVCGGSSNGYCSGSGCVCLPPWVGNTCTSQIIIVPTPSTNTTSPTVEIPIGGEDGSSNSIIDEIFYKSLISVVSLRELDFNQKQIKIFTFDRWILTELAKGKNQYFTSINALPDSVNPIMTNITVLLEWYSNETIISFANQELTMNPSTIKFTVNITKYPFSSGLNTLQLILAASFESSKSNDVCSTEEFGETGDNFNYIKLQIENKSLYGRFIKRAIIDDEIKSIDNVLLDSNLNIVGTENGNNNVDNSASFVQSYIGITIPYYKSEIKLDPDFSVLLDNNPVSSDDENSVCKSSTPALSKTQLAGIIVGAFGFAAVASIITAYFVVQKRKQKKFETKMNNRLSTLGESK